MKLLFSAVFAWWFMFQAYHSYTIVGPFHTEKQCKTIREYTIGTYRWGNDIVKECISDNPDDSVTKDKSKIKGK